MSEKELTKNTLSKTKKIPPKLKLFHIDDRTLEMGVDEAGRGPLWGRVYAAAVIWDPSVTSSLIKDSKKFKNHKDRLIAYDFVKEHCLSYGVGYAEPDEIDEVNILQATMNAMHRAIKNCYVEPQHILVDGTHFRMYENDEDEVIDYTTVTGGDDTYYSIAAASIIAKVERDLYIEQICDQDTNLDLYDLRSNKGYGAKKHLEAIEHWGVTPYHRRSFGLCKTAKEAKF